MGTTDHGPRRLELTTLMTPDMQNFSGKVHGGSLLKLLDEVAYSCASRYARSYVVTLLVDDAIFRGPVHVGELVTCLACVNHVGRTSMEIGMRVVSEDPRSGVQRHVMSCFFVMISMNEAGEPQAVSRFEFEDAEDERRWAAAEERREVRTKSIERSKRGDQLGPS